MEGVWHVVQGADRFGDSVAIKMSGDGLTIYARPNVSYIVLEAGYLDSVVFLEGYWREQVNTNTGLARFVIPRTAGGGWVIHDGDRPDSMVIQGSYTLGNEIFQVRMNYARPFSAKARETFYTISHRGGGRTADRIPYAENTSALLEIAERFGANAVEIDIRLSSDGIPFLYHDKELNPRLVQRGALVGAPEDYPFNVLQQYVTLIGGERIPTFEEALMTVVEKTNIEFVYLDTKSENRGLISVMWPIVQKAIDRAAEIPGRAPFRPYIGLPTQDVYDEFVAIPGHQDLPSLCELSLDQARAIKADVWGPRWTLGTQNDLVKQAQAEGMLVVTWTLDLDTFVASFIETGSFNGILTNYPTLVTYHWLMQ
jgi:glycerophosphoryl diester phosphodiesterase